MDTPFTTPHPHLGKIAVYEGDDGRPRAGFVVEDLARDPRVRVVDLDDHAAYLRDGDGAHLEGRWLYTSHLTILGAEVLASLSDLSDTLITSVHTQPTPTG